jgi:hypothetical protein
VLLITISGFGWVPAFEFISALQQPNETRPGFFSHWFLLLPRCRCAGFAVGSPTLGGHVPTPVSEAIGAILKTDARHLPYGVFGSYGWSGEAVRTSISLVKPRVEIHVVLGCVAGAGDAERAARRRVPQRRLRPRQVRRHSEQRWESLRIVMLGFFGWEMAHEAVSPRPPISLDTIVARTHMCTYAAKVWDFSIVQGPFSVAPCQTLTLRFGKFCICTPSAPTHSLTPLNSAVRRQFEVRTHGRHDGEAGGGW